MNSKIDKGDIFTFDDGAEFVRLSRYEELEVELSHRNRPLEHDNYTLTQKILSLETDLERERICHAGCGVIAMCNTEKSLALNRKMHSDYMSASMQDCIKAAEREIALIADVQRLNIELALSQKDYKSARDDNKHLRHALDEANGREVSHDVDLILKNDQLQSDLATEKEAHASCLLEYTRCANDLGELRRLHNSSD